MPDRNEFREHDTFFGVWSTGANDRATYDAVKRTLKRLGFGWVQDPRIKAMYPCLAKSHHYGMKGDLQFTAEIFGLHIKVEFFQDVVTENPNGGRYDFDKRAKMPYLVRKRYEHTAAALRTMLVARGFADDTKETPKTAADRVRIARAESEQWHPGYDAEMDPRNVTDADGVVMKEGDVRYFRDYKGRLMRGRVSFRPGNCHWVVANDRTASAGVACFEMFSWRPGLRRKDFWRPQRRVAALVDRAAARKDYAEAARLQAVLARMDPGMAAERTKAEA